jgi:hypothetical protein
VTSARAEPIFGEPVDYFFELDFGCRFVLGDQLLVEIVHRHELFEFGAPAPPRVSA